MGGGGGVTDELTRAYLKGYYAGSRGRWPNHKPPNPPQEQVLALFVAAKDLADAANDVLSVIIPDEDIFIALKNQLDSVDSAFSEISKWLRDQGAKE